MAFMADALEKLEIVKKDRQRMPFRARGSELDFSLLDYWRWLTSDLVGNTARGVLAEYIVARAQKIPTGEEIRDEWAPFDLENAGWDKDNKDRGQIRGVYPELEAVSLLAGQLRHARDGRMGF